MKSHRPYLAFFFGPLFFVPLLAPADDAAPRGITEVLQPFVDRHALAGAVTLVADKERVLSLEAVGFADVAAHKPMPTDAIFWIASQSKPITATALMMLVDESKVKLDDPVAKYLPGFNGQWLAAERDKEHVLLRKPKHPITIRNILSHTSGMPFASALERPTLDSLPLRVAVGSYAMTPLQFQPDSKYQYSNAGINTAGRIIEVVSGMPYEAFLDKRLFEPLGMKDTTFWPDDEQLRRLAKSYKPNAAKSDLEETTIVGKALFGAELGGEAETVERSSTRILEHTWRRLEKLIDLPPWFPSRANRRFRCELQALDRIVHRLIAERRANDAGANDLLTLLLQRCDEETGQRMTDEQLRNETLTLLLAGHETTANALTWTWYLLAKHPHEQRRLAAEVADVLGDRVPTAEDLPRLRYTTQIIKESMRLYPPIWIMERRALADDTIGGYFIPAGSSVVISPYVLHRHLSFWENPEEFDPERFAPQATAARNPHCYVPFGLGQRLCIGNHFALMEAQIIVAMMTQAFRLELVPGTCVEPKPGITLRTRHGLPMRIVSRGERNRTKEV